MTSVMENFADFIHHRHDPAATGPDPTTQETPMSALTEARTIAETLGVHLARLAANPLVDAIAEAGLGMVLTPGEITFLVGMIREFEQARANAPSQPLPQPIADAAAQ